MSQNDNDFIIDTSSHKKTSNDDSSLHKELAKTLIEIIIKSSDPFSLFHTNELASILSLVTSKKYYYSHLNLNQQNTDDIAQFEKFENFLYQPLLNYLEESISFDVEFYKHGEKFTSSLRQRYAIITRHRFYSSTKPIKDFSEKKSKDKTRCLDYNSVIKIEEYDEKAQNEWSNKDKAFRVVVNYINSKNENLSYYFYLDDKKKTETVYKMLNNIRYENVNNSTGGIITDIEKIVQNCYITYGMIKMLTVKRKEKNRRLMLNYINDTIKEDKNEFHSVMKTINEKIKRNIEQCRQYTTKKSIISNEQQNKKINSIIDIQLLKKSVMTIVNAFPSAKIKRKEKNKISLAIRNTEDKLNIDYSTKTIALTSKKCLLNEDEIINASYIIYNISSNENEVDEGNVIIYGPSEKEISFEYESISNEVFFDDYYINNDSMKDCAIDIFHIQLNKKEIAKITNIKSVYFYIEVVINNISYYQSDLSDKINYEDDKEICFEFNYEIKVSSKKHQSNPKISFTLYMIDKVNIDKNKKNQYLLPYITKNIFSSFEISLNDIISSRHQIKLTPFSASFMLISIRDINTKNFTLFTDFSLKLNSYFYIKDTLTQKKIDSLLNDNSIPLLVKEKIYSKEKKGKKRFLCKYKGMNNKRELLIENEYDKEIKCIRFNKSYCMLYSNNDINVLNYKEIKKSTLNPPNSIWKKEISLMNQKEIDIFIELFKRIRRQCVYDGLNKEKSNEIDIPGVIDGIKKEYFDEKGENIKRMSLLIDKIEFKDDFELSSNTVMKVNLTKSNEGKKQNENLIDYLKNNSIMKHNNFKEIYTQNENFKSHFTKQFGKIIHINKDTFNNGSKVFSYGSLIQSQREISIQINIMNDINFSFEIVMDNNKYTSPFSIKNIIVDYIILPIYSNCDIIGIIYFKLLISPINKQLNYDNEIKSKIEQFTKDNKKYIKSHCDIIELNSSQRYHLKKKFSSASQYKKHTKLYYNMKLSSFYNIFTTKQLTQLLLPLSSTKHKSLIHLLPFFPPGNKLSSSMLSSIQSLIYLGLPSNTVRKTILSSLLLVDDIYNKTNAYFNSKFKSKGDLYLFFDKIVKTNQTISIIDTFIDIDASQFSNDVKAIVKSFYKWSELKIDNISINYTSSLIHFADKFFKNIQSPSETFWLLIGMTYKVSILTNQINDEIFNCIVIIKLILQTHCEGLYNKLLTLDFPFDYIAVRHINSLLSELISDDDVYMSIVDIIIYESVFNDMNYLRVIISIIVTMMMMNEKYFTEAKSVEEVVDIFKGMKRNVYNVRDFMKTVNQNMNKFFYNKSLIMKIFMKKSTSFSYENSIWDEKRKNVLRVINSTYNSRIDKERGVIEKGSNAIKKDFNSKAISVKWKEIIYNDIINPLFNSSNTMTYGVIVIINKVRGYRDKDYTNFEYEIFIDESIKEKINKCNKSCELKALSLKQIKNLYIRNDISQFVINLERIDFYDAQQHIELINNNIIIDISLMKYISSNKDNSLYDEFLMLFSQCNQDIFNNTFKSIYEIKNVQSSQYTKEAKYVNYYINRNVFHNKTQYLNDGIIDTILHKLLPNTNINIIKELLLSTSLTLNEILVHTILNDSTMINANDILNNLFTLCLFMNPYFDFSYITYYSLKDLVLILCKRYKAFFTKYDIDKILMYHLNKEKMSHIKNVIAYNSKDYQKIKRVIEDKERYTDEISTKLFTDISHMFIYKYYQYKSSSINISNDIIKSIVSDIAINAVNSNFDTIMIQYQTAFNSYEYFFSFTQNGDITYKNESHINSNELFESSLQDLFNMNTYSDKKITFDIFKQVILSFPYISDGLRRDITSIHMHHMNSLHEVNEFKVITLNIMDKNNLLYTFMIYQNESLKKKKALPIMEIIYSFTAYNSIKDIYHVVLNKLLYSQCDINSIVKDCLYEDISNFSFTSDNKTIDIYLPLYMSLLSLKEELTINVDISNSFDNKKNDISLYKGSFKFFFDNEYYEWRKCDILKHNKTNKYYVNYSGSLFEVTNSDITIN